VPKRQEINTLVSIEFLNLTVGFLHLNAQPAGKITFWFHYFMQKKMLIGRKTTTLYHVLFVESERQQSLE
jgi:hypothetical protein